MYTTIRLLDLHPVVQEEYNRIKLRYSFKTLSLGMMRDIREFEQDDHDVQDECRFRDKILRPQNEWTVDAAHLNIRVDELMKMTDEYQDALMEMTDEYQDALMEMTEKMPKVKKK